MRKGFFMPEASAKVNAMTGRNITITLPDGSARTYPAGTTGMEIAESIGKSLAKAAVAINTLLQRQDDTP